MKKLLILIVILFGVTMYSFSQLNLMFTPSEGSKMKKKWLKEFILNNNEGITLHCDTTQKTKTDYLESTSFLVLIKNEKVIVLFNHNDSSYIISPHRIPEIEDDDCGSFYERLIYGNDWSVPNAFDVIKNKLGAESILPLNQKNFQSERKKL